MTVPGSNTPATPPIDDYSLSPHIESLVSDSSELTVPPITWNYRGSRQSYWDIRPHADKTLLFVHGFRGDHHGLLNIAALLPEYRIVIPDLPGFGASEPFTSTPSIHSFAELVNSLADRLEFATPPVLVGHSFGSIVASYAEAQRALENDTEKSLADTTRYRGLVLINPIAAPALEGPNALFTQLAESYYRWAAALPEKSGTALLTNPLIVRVMSIAMAKTRRPRLRKYIHSQHDAYFSSFADRTAVLDAFRVSTAFSVRDVTRHIAIPTLLIAAEKDDVTRLDDQHALKQSLKDQGTPVSLRVVANTGHLVHYEAPELAATFISDFVKDLDYAG